MKKKNLYEPFEIVYEEVDQYGMSAHQHSFFELVYVISGSGLQCINNNAFRYNEGHMFLITPDDCHSFDVQETTHFLYIRFNNIYLQDNIFEKATIKKLEFILENANHQPGCILKNQIDKKLVTPIVDAMAREHVNRDLHSKELIQQLVNTLIIIVARNIAKFLPENTNEQTDKKSLDILQYIQSNIYEPKKLKSETIANQFGVSQSYLGRYFKKHTNETMQQYIINYKLKLIEMRLLYSDLRINEIVSELGFSDESHLNRIFKKHKGINPSEFRKQRTL